MNDPLREYARAIRQWWRVVVVITLVVVGLGAGYLLLKPVKYEATAVFFVSTPRDDAGTQYQGDAYARARMLSYVPLGQSLDLAREVVAKTRLDIDPGVLAASTALKPETESVLLVLTVDTSSPQTALVAAQGYVPVLQQRVNDLESVPGALNPRAELNVVQSPTVSGTPAGTAAWMVLGATAVLGLFLGLAGAVIRALVDTRVRTAQDAAAASASRVLVESQAPTSVDPVQDAHADVLFEIARILRGVVNDFAPQGGVVEILGRADDATPYSLALAMVTAQAGKSVVVLEFAREARLQTEFDLAGSPTIEDVLERDASSVPEFASWNGVHIVPTGRQFADVTGGVVDDPRVSGLIDDLRARFDWVILDVPDAYRRSDAVRIARIGPICVVVCGQGRTTVEELTSLREEVDSIGGRCVGLIYQIPAIAAQSENSSTGNRSTGNSSQDVSGETTAAEVVPRDTPSSSGVS